MLTFTLNWFEPRQFTIIGVFIVHCI